MGAEKKKRLRFFQFNTPLAWHRHRVPVFREKLIEFALLRYAAQHFKFDDKILEMLNVRFSSKFNLRRISSEAHWSETVRV